MTVPFISYVLWSVSFLNTRKLKGKFLTRVKRTIKKFDPVRVILSMKFMSLGYTMVTLRSEALLYMSTPSDAWHSLSWLVQEIGRLHAIMNKKRFCGAVARIIHYFAYFHYCFSMWCKSICKMCKKAPGARNDHRRQQQQQQRRKLTKPSFLAKPEAKSIALPSFWYEGKIDAKERKDNQRVRVLPWQENSQRCQMNSIAAYFLTLLRPLWQECTCFRVDISTYESR